MTTPIKRHRPWGDSVPAEFVTIQDHLASHAFDEAKERALFETYASSLQPMLPDKYFARFACGEYAREDVQEPWLVWMACAKSRANRFGEEK
jgi:hypothetical protein